MIYCIWYDNDPNCYELAIDPWNEVWEVELVWIPEWIRNKKTIFVAERTRA